MKNVKVISLGLMVIGMLLASMPAMAQQAQEWQSTSTMQMSGSNYSAQVGAIGATTVSDMATTTSSRPSRIKGRQSESDWGETPEVGEGNTGSPIGDALIPLLLCALAFCGVIAFRRRGKAMTD